MEYGSERRRRLTALQVYVFPIPITLLTAWLWWHWSGDLGFTLTVSLIAIAFGYVLPGIGTNVLKLWRFHGPFRMGNYYYHHGFIWAANLSPVLLISFLGTPEGPLSIGTIVRVLLCTAAVHAYKGWVFDLALHRHGFAEATVPELEGAGPEEVVAHYVPTNFFLIGLGYGIAGLLAYHFFVFQQRTDFIAQLSVWIFGLGSMLILPALDYGFYRWRRSGFAANHSTPSVPSRPARNA